ncbi:MAG: Fe-S cluster assembly protein SufB [Puniceicoccales bacterium]|jgi:Fe-S cluster assembly protein SufB|nr:Fe-S cluster assembly protein SufB [Puniceicoccales bacterium]
MAPQDLDFSSAAGDFSYGTDYAYDAGSGLTEDTVRYISGHKEEPRWLLEFRLEALELFRRLEMPDWAPMKKSDLDYENIRCYLARGDGTGNRWEDVPAEVKETFDRLGVPEQEKKFLAGVEAQFDSEMAYANLKDDLQRQGVIFVSSSEGLLRYESLFRPYFGTVVAAAENPFSALNGAVFSGGSFIYVPPGVKIDRPLQAYFRINAERSGQFERTLIVVGENARVTYLEGCTAPKFETATLHAAVVEVVVLAGAEVQYITVQNWSANVYNLVTKRALAHQNATVRWIDCNVGSRLTMKYPSVILAGEGASGSVLSISVAKDGQLQDTGARMVHRASKTHSRVVAKSLSIGGGSAIYRGTISMAGGFERCRSHSRCDGLLLREDSISRTFPHMDCGGTGNVIEHEASVSKISDEQLFYLRQRGIGESQALGLLVNGFFDELIREFPMEYGVELKRLIEMEMEKVTTAGEVSRG